LSRFVQGQALFAVLGKAIPLVNRTVFVFVINDGQKFFHGHQFRKSGIEAGNHAFAVGVMFEVSIHYGLLCRHHQRQIATFANIMHVAQKIGAFFLQLFCIDC
jgi:hypothetical protein